jgi:hypothetical protein
MTAILQPPSLTGPRKKTAAKQAPSVSKAQPKPTKIRPGSRQPHRIADLSFTLDFAEAIKRGELSLTLRAMPPHLFAPGQRLAVRVRDYAEIEVLEVSRKRLGDLTEADARAEGGHHSLNEFRRIWAASHNGFRPNEFVTVLRFRLAPV